MAGSVAVPQVAPVAERYAGRVAVVTGGASGIGAATVARLLDEGAAHVAVLDLAPGGDAGAPVGSRTSALETDVADPRAVEAAFAAVVAAQGRVDVVVHAAGVDDPALKQALRAAREAGGPVDVFRHLGDDAWRRVLSVNLDGTFHVLRAALDVMVPQGHGVVVTVASSAAYDALEGYAPYAASKAGVKALSQSVAKEAARHGVRVTTIAPGPVVTPMTERTPSSVRPDDDAPREPASAAEIADTICFLASPGAANLVGAVLLSNGGRFTV